MKDGFGVYFLGEIMGWFPNEELANWFKSFQKNNYGISCEVKPTKIEVTSNSKNGPTMKGD